jgi:hypothetical protein
VTPHKQLHRHDPENDVWGDCFRTAVACLLDEVPSLVPHVCHGGMTGVESTQRMNDWLVAEHRLTLVEFPFMGELQDVMGTMENFNPGLTYLLTGRSRNGVSHVVICRSRRIIHDPSLDDSGIVGPCQDSVPNAYWVGILASSLLRAP